MLGGCGVWPAAGQACGGYLVEHDGFHLLVDPGYATLPRLLERMPADLVDAVVVSHGHPDHCADLNPLLRARHLGGPGGAPLPVYALAGALDAVLALDRPEMLDDAFTLRELEPGQDLAIGPFEVETVSLPHFVQNVGLRMRAGGSVLSYTGDTGPSPNLLPLAREADVFLAEATFPRLVPPDMQRHLSSALQAGEVAARSSVRHLVLTHLQPDTNPAAAETAAAARLFDTVVAGLARSHPGLEPALWELLPEQLLDQERAGALAGRRREQGWRGRFEALRRVNDELTARLSELEREHTELLVSQSSSVESATLLGAIFDTTGEGILTVDRHGVILRANRAALALWGYADTEVVGKDIGLLLAGGPLLYSAMGGRGPPRPR